MSRRWEMVMASLTLASFVVRAVRSMTPVCSWSSAIVSAAATAGRRCVRSSSPGADRAATAPAAPRAAVTDGHDPGSTDHGSDPRRRAERSAVSSRRRRPRRRPSRVASPTRGDVPSHAGRRAAARSSRPSGRPEPARRTARPSQSRTVDPRPPRTGMTPPARRPRARRSSDGQRDAPTAAASRLAPRAAPPVHQ